MSESKFELTLRVRDLSVEQIRAIGELVDELRARLEAITGAEPEGGEACAHQVTWVITEADE